MVRSPGPVGFGDGAASLVGAVVIPGMGVAAGADGAGAGVGAGVWAGAGGVRKRNQSVRTTEAHTVRIQRLPFPSPARTLSVTFPESKGEDTTRFSERPVAGLFDAPRRVVTRGARRPILRRDGQGIGGGHRVEKRWVAVDTFFLDAR
jgi:hypothetical protein